MKKRDLKVDQAYLLTLEINRDERLRASTEELLDVATYWLEKYQSLLKVEEWGGQYFINEAYRPIAEALAHKYEELSHIGVHQILFIENTTGSGTTLDKRKNAQVSKVPSRWREILTQLTGRRFEYVMEFFKKNISEMSREQIVTLIYHELRHIDTDGDLKHHDIEEWQEVAEKIGTGWSERFKSIPDLLADDVDWGSIQRDKGLFSDNSELQVRLELVK